MSNMSDDDKLWRLGIARDLGRLEGQHNELSKNIRSMQVQVDRLLFLIATRDTSGLDTSSGDLRADMGSIKDRLDKLERFPLKKEGL